MRTSLIIPVLTLMTFPLMAKESIEFEDRLAVGSASQFVLEVPVGEVNIRAYEGDSIEYRVRVTESDGNWFSSVDMDDAEIQQDISSDRIKLEIDMEDSKQEWYIKVPAHMSMVVELGVGELDIEDAERDLELEVGVGSIEVTLNARDYRRIELESGVGDVDLDGFSNQEKERAFISEETTWRGDGRYEIKAQVGVGEIEVQAK